jgi:hypothetical protein
MERDKDPPVPAYMPILADAVYRVSPPLYYVAKAMAYRAHQRYRQVVQDEPGVKWEDSRHKKALEKVYKY